VFWQDVPNGPVDRRAHRPLERRIVECQRTSADSRLGRLSSVRFFENRIPCVAAVPRFGVRGLGGWTAGQLPAGGCSGVRVATAVSDRGNADSAQLSSSGLIVGLARSAVWIQTK
jgi:hypothetical protein